MLELRNVVKRYNDHIIFDNLNVGFSSCGIYLISGESGSGKSTLLNIISGYEGFESGERYIEKGIKIASIFQQYELIQDLTILENIKLHLDVYDKELDYSYIRALGLEELLNHYPNELSIGQKQRVGILRALYQSPDIIICDEPIESLDIDNKEIVLNLLQLLSKTKIIIIACHDINLMSKYYDYHYKVVNKDIECIESKESQALSLKDEQYNLNTKKLKKYIHKIIKKRTLIINIIITVLIITQSLLFQIDNRLFETTKMYNGLNANSLYVRLYEDDASIINKYLSLDNVCRPLLSFKSINYNNKLYKINIYPLDTVKNNEIILNQDTVDLLNTDKESIVGKTLTLSYNLINKERSIEFKVKDVVDEDIYTSAHIYYNYDYVCDFLKNQEGSSLYENEYEYFIEESRYFEITDNDDIENLYHWMSNDSALSLIHNGIEGSIRNKNDSLMFMYLFRFVEVLLAIISFVIVIYYDLKDSFKNKVSLSIIHSMNISLSSLKKIYIKDKLMLSSVLILLGCSYFVDYKMLIYTVLLILIHILVICINIIKMKNQDILMILKEEKDI